MLSIRPTIIYYWEVWKHWQRQGTVLFLHFLTLAGSSSHYKEVIWHIFGLPGWQFHPLEIRRNTKEGWYWAQRRKCSPTEKWWELGRVTLSRKINMNVVRRVAQPLGRQIAKSSEKTSSCERRLQKVRNLHKLFSGTETPKRKWRIGLQSVPRDTDTNSSWFHAGHCSKLTATPRDRHYSSFCKWANWITKTDLLGITQLVSGRGGISAQQSDFKDPK